MIEPLAAMVAWLAEAAAAGVVGNRMDAALLGLTRSREHAEAIVKLASSVAEVAVDPDRFAAWLDDQQTVGVLARLVALPETSGEAGLKEVAGRFADDLVTGAQR